MTLSKKTLIFIGAGIFVIVVAVLASGIVRKLDEQRKVEKQLATAQQRLQGLQLEQLIAQKAKLEERLKQVTPQFESAKDKISQPISSTAAATTLFDAAKANNLIVTEMTSTSLTDETLEGADLLVMSMKAEVNGKASDMVNLISGLNRSFTTGVVKSVAITVPEGSSSDNASASIQMVIYTYRGN